MKILRVPDEMVGKITLGVQKAPIDSRIFTGKFSDFFDVSIEPDPDIEVAVERFNAELLEGEEPITYEEMEAILSE